MLSVVTIAGFSGVSQTTPLCEFATGTDLRGICAKLSNLLTSGISIQFVLLHYGEQGMGRPRTTALGIALECDGTESCDGFSGTSGHAMRCREAMRLHFTLAAVSYNPGDLLTAHDTITFSASILPLFELERAAPRRLSMRPASPT